MARHKPDSSSGLGKPPERPFLTGGQQALVHGRSLPNTELAEDDTAELVAHGGRQRKAEPCAHGHSQVSEVLGVHDAKGPKGVDGCPPFVCHSIEDDFDPPSAMRA
ncbi:hypothetical protein [Allorhizocola rhizosphaerae]|uniref:hypothetical protein n=1 Tax=Allorhizocola rhizosphaerae TaxID=1872709 RepID=UPI0013C2FD21|nr:hypothetical protein [Allorhizocola rhizosphaerae]